MSDQNQNENQNQNQSKNVDGGFDLNKMTSDIKSLKDGADSLMSKVGDVVKNIKNFSTNGMSGIMQSIFGKSSDNSKDKIASNVENIAKNANEESNAESTNKDHIV